MSKADFKAKIENIGVDFSVDMPLQAYTSFKIGGNADFIVKPVSQEELTGIIDAAKFEKIPFYFLGGGSNVLVSDSGYRGVIILTNGFSNIKLIDKNVIYCESGVTIAKLCSFAQSNGLSGMEFAFGIPGSVGGGIYMNAGAYGGEIKDVIVSCKYIDENGNMVEKKGEELDFSYRHSIFTNSRKFILSAEFSLIADDKKKIRERMDDFLTRRKEKQPLEFPSAGSTFKRPESGYASAMIDECGLKGLTVGGAQVSEKHAGFVINRQNAKAADVVDLIEQIKKEVLKQKGISLECEICKLGF